MAATGMVTQKVPVDFPTADRTRTRREYDPPADWTSPGARLARKPNERPSDRWIRFIF